MNIRITHNWLLEYLDTDANPREIQKYLSLCGPSVEKVEPYGDDFAYDIEITSNRVDSASVMGIAREAAAILPRFGKKALFRHKKYREAELPVNNFTLAIEDKQKLSARIMAVIFDQVKIKDSPEYIRKRLAAVGVRSLNNLVDITNYVMIETGHPAHVFDFERVKTGKFIIRTAKTGEKLVTLDKKNFLLKGGEIVFDDGTGRIVDLPSIMGTENSVVTNKSQRVIFFIDNIDPVLVRRASMIHGIRTMAATYNEKSIDPEIAQTTFYRGIELFGELANPKSISRTIDVYPNPTKVKQLKIGLEFIHSRIGVGIPDKDIVSILRNLQFGTELKGDTLLVEPPSFRSRDMHIPEDVVEEIARIYGYHNLPSNLQQPVFVKQPKAEEKFLEYQSKIKWFLKHLGLNEIMNYSMISREAIEKVGLKIDDHLKIKNSISEEITYMRTHLGSSLIQNIKNNEGKRDLLKFFEIAKTYKPRESDLPLEEFKLGIATNSNFYDIKGISEALFRELNLPDYDYASSDNPLLDKKQQVKVTINGTKLGTLGTMVLKFRHLFGIKSNVCLAVFDFNNLIKYAKTVPNYKSINPYAVIKLDKTFQLTPNCAYKTIAKAANQSELLQRVDVVSVYQNKLTLRFYYASTKRNLTEDEAKKELSKIS